MIRLMIVFIATTPLDVCSQDEGCSTIQESESLSIILSVKFREKG